MSEIRRYFANAASESDGWLYVELSEDADGDYCRWDDVALLTAERDRLREALREAKRLAIQIKECSLEPDKVYLYADRIRVLQEAEK